MVKSVRLLLPEDTRSLRAAIRELAALLADKDEDYLVGFLEEVLIEDKDKH